MLTSRDSATRTLSKRISTAALALLSSLMAALAPPASAIDDTEIFFNPVGSVSSPNKPNVLFILDNSGSMSECFAYSGSTCQKTRMQALKDAMSDLLNSDDVYSGINAGVILFDGSDSESEYIPLFYPVEPLELDASSVDDGPTLGSGTKVRDRLLKIVDNMQPRGGTPIVGALYEAARYLTGSTVGFTDAGTVYGVAHKSSVTGGTFANTTCTWVWVGSRRNGYWTQQCTSSASCKSATLDTDRCTTLGTPAPTYISPLTSDRGTPFTAATKPDCAQTDYVVLITDGLPTSSTSNLRDKVRTLTGVNSCANSAGGTDGQCGAELTKFLHGDYNSGDIRSSQTGKQWAITHTIALALSDTNGLNYLNELSSGGGGKSYTANDPQQLASALSEIISKALSRSAATGVPAVSLNVFNPLYTRNDVYLTMFDPTPRQRWAGNVKKYKFCAVRDNPATTAVEGCPVDGGTTVPFGTYLSKGSTSSTYVKATDSSGDFLLTSKDLWNTTNTQDGSKVRAGGAGSVLDAADKSQRKLYTYSGSYDSNKRLPATTSSTTNPDLTQNINLLNTRSSYTCTSSTATDNCNLTPALFGISGGLSAANVTSMNKIIQWIRDPGLDVYDGNGNGSTTDYYDPEDDDNDGLENDKWWPFEDPMHASAIAWEYGGSSSAPVTKLFVPTNNGGLRMLNADTGAEEWMFIPQELLARQSALMDTDALLPAGTRNFGLDMTPVIWVRDDNDNDTTNGVYPNGQIEPSKGDYVRLVVGQRDGGRAYYALDVTPTADVTSSTTSVTIKPKLLWKIEGGVTSGFDNLQNTWSRPTRGRVRVNNSVKNVLIFGGGNPVGAASTTSPGGFNYRYGTNRGNESEGNIVYIVDAETGELIYSIGGAGTSATKKTASNSTGMNYPIPSAITALDTSGDGLTDRLYFGDLGGNVWRVDLYNTGSNSDLTASVGKLADVAPTVVGPPATGKPSSSVTTRQPLNVNSRAFYYPPAVVQVNKPDFGGRFDLVILASGQRNNPRNGQDNAATGNATVVNHLYTFMDLKIAPTDKAGDSDFPKRKSGMSGSGALGLSDLMDLTNDAYQMTRNSTTGKLELSSTQKTSLKTAYATNVGWYITLSNTGEKGVSAASVTNDILVVNTYTPAVLSDSTTSCNAPNPGTGRIYALDLFTASSVFASFDTTDSGGTTPTVTDRANVGVGMPVEGSNLGSTDAGLVLLTNHGGGDPDGANGDQSGATNNDNMGSGSGSIDPLKGLPRGRIYWYER